MSHGQEVEGKCHVPLQYSRKVYLFLCQRGEMDLIQRIDSDVTNMDTISNKFIAIPWKFKCPFTCPVQNNK